MASVRDFGAKGDGQTDDSTAIQHAVEQGDGHVVFPRGNYRLTRTILVPLEKFGRLCVQGEGGTAKLLWSGSGPALHIVGTHAKTADPTHFVEGVWQKERMPTFRDFEIVGNGADGDGIRVEGVMQPFFHGLLIRRCRHGIHLVKRNRNVDISDCHIYDNAGIGVYLDHVNLHQINIHGNHISYCKRGGVVVDDGEVRNIQICSNDIEYNYDVKEKQSADVWFNAGAGSIREGTIVGNTIQAKVSPGGANVRFTGAGNDNPNAIGMISITGNLIGSQETNLHLNACRGVVVSGNSIYGGEQRALWVEFCEHLVFSGNSHDHNSDYKGNSTDAIWLDRSRNIGLHGLMVQHTRPAAVPVEASVDVHRCQNVNVTGCQIVNSRTRGIRLRGCQVVRVADCTIRAAAGDAGFRAAIQVNDLCQSVMIANNFLDRGPDGDVHAAASKTIHLQGNVTLNG